MQRNPDSTDMNIPENKEIKELKPAPSDLPIYLRNSPEWPGEVFDHPQFIASIAKWYKPKIFIEYGTGTGGATKVFAPHCGRVIGVDLSRSVTENIPNLEMYNMSTRDFKDSILSKIDSIDMAFIDADHKSEVAFQDFIDLFSKLTEGGIIFIHDTFPSTEKWIKPCFCNDSWKVPELIKLNFAGLCEVLTIPIQPGLTIIRKYFSGIPHLNPYRN